MKKWQKIIIRVIATAVLAGVLLLLIFSSDRFGADQKPVVSPTPTVTSAPTETPSPAPSPTPTETPTPTPRPTATPTPTEPIYPYTDVEGINYVNYATGMSKIVTIAGELTLGDYGYYTFIDAHGAEHTYRMADYVEIEGEQMSEGDWFFAGALSTPNYVFAQYDYWGNERYTIFIRLTRTGRNGKMLAYMPYDEFENYRCFTASNEYIFYVRNSVQGYEIVQTDLDGNAATVLASFGEKERPSGLWCMEYELIFRLSDGENYTIAYLDLNSGKIEKAKKVSSVSEYLYVFDRAAVTGVSGQKLCYVDLDTMTEKTVALGTAKDMYYGEPVYFEGVTYLQYFNWSTKTTTALAIDLKTSRVKEDLVLADTLTYICGISDHGLMTEKNGGYEELNLAESNEE